MKASIILALFVSLFVIGQAQEATTSRKTSQEFLTLTIENKKYRATALLEFKPEGAYLFLRGGIAIAKDGDSGWLYLLIEDIDSHSFKVANCKLVLDDESIISLVDRGYFFANHEFGAIENKYRLTATEMQKLAKVDVKYIQTNLVAIVQGKQSSTVKFNSASYDEYGQKNHYSGSYFVRDFVKDLLEAN
jgi:hypothetical protein